MPDNFNVNFAYTDSQTEITNGWKTYTEADRNYKRVLKSEKLQWASISRGTELIQFVTTEAGLELLDLD